MSKTQEMILGLFAIPIMFVSGGVVWTVFWMLVGWCCIEADSLIGRIM